MRDESPSSADKLDTRNARYVREYEAWVSSMSPEERAKLEALKLDKPLLDYHHASGIGLDEDIADSPAASYAPDMAALIDGEDAPAGADQPSADASSADIDPDMVWDVMRRLIGELLDTPNRSLTAECLAAVSGMSYTGDSLTGIAQRHGVSRAAVSKRCVELTRKLALLPSRTMRSLTARTSYRHAQLHIRHSYEN